MATTLPTGALAPGQTEQVGSKAAVTLLDSLLSTPSLPQGTSITPQAQSVQTNELLATPGVTGTLAAQAANGSNTDEDRLAIQEEMRALMEEVNRVAADTTFGGENLLDGTYNGVFQVGSDAVQTIGFSMQNVGGTANTISDAGGFTLSGIASIASAITGGEALSAKLEGLSDSLGSDFQATAFNFAGTFEASGISVSTQANAQAVLAGMDSLIAVVDKKRAELGAVQNRFQSTINNQANISENLSAAQSRIKDADFAAETAKLTQSQILQQASQAILAQANQRPQAALSLLG